MASDADDLGPAEGELRVMLDLALARGWRVVWAPTRYVEVNPTTKVPQTIPHYLITYADNRTRMIGVNAAGAKELMKLLESHAFGKYDALNDVLRLSMRSTTATNAAGVIGGTRNVY